MTRFDRRALFASGAAAALLAASGVSVHEQPKRGGRLRAALSSEPGEAWDAPAPSTFRQVARHAVHEGLTQIAADGTLRGNLAEAWESPDSGRTWVFTLRTAQWHDGSDVMHEQIAKVLGGSVDKGRVVLPASPADAALPMRIANTLVAHPDNPLLGTGLYALAEYTPGRRAVLERVNAHARDGAAGWADVVDLAGMANAQTRMDALLHDMVDVIDHPHDPAPHGMTRLGDALAGNRVQAPAQIGKNPLDDYRLAERWWLARV